MEEWTPPADAESKDGESKWTPPADAVDASSVKKKVKSEPIAPLASSPSSTTSPASSTGSGILDFLTQGINSKLPSASPTSVSEPSKSESTGTTPEGYSVTVTDSGPSVKSPVDSYTKGGFQKQSVKEEKQKAESAIAAVVAKKDFTDTNAAYEEAKKNMATLMDVLNNPVADPLQKQLAQNKLQEMAPDVKAISEKKQIYDNQIRGFANTVKENADKLKAIVEHNASNVEGAGKSFVTGMADIVESMQGANDFISKYVLGYDRGDSKGGYSALADAMKEGVEDFNDVSNNLGGKVVSGVAGSVPIMLATALAPETAIPKFATTMGAVAFGKSYKENKDVVKAVEEGAHGLAEGALLHGLGVFGSNSGEWLAKTKLGRAIGEDLSSKAAAALITSTGFGGEDAVKQYLSTGKINIDDVLASAGTGLAFSVGGLAKATYERAFTKTISAPPEIVTAAINSERTPVELRDASTEVLADAVGKTADEKAKAYLISKTLTATADLKSVGEEIAANPASHITDVINSDMPEAQKKAAIANINAIVEQNNVNIKAAEPLKQEKANLETQLESAKLIEDPDLRDAQINNLTEEIKSKQKEIESVLSKPIEKKEEVKSEVPTKAESYIHSLPEEEMVKLENDIKQADTVEKEQALKKQFEENSGLKISDEEFRNLGKGLSSVLHDTEATISEPLKPKENAIQKQSASSVLPHTQEGIGETGSERSGMGQGQQGSEVAKEGEKEKVKNIQALPNEDFVKAFIDSGQLVSVGTHNMRISFPDMQPAEIKKALADRAEGKETAATKRLEANILQIKESGKVPMMEGVGGMTSSVNMDLKDFESDIIAHSKEQPVKPVDPLEGAVGMTKAAIETQIEDRGLQKIVKQAKRDSGKDFEKAVADVESGESGIHQVGEEILQGKRQATAQQKLEMGYSLTKSIDKYDKLIGELKKAQEFSFENTELENAVELAEAEMSFWQNVNDKSQSEWGLFGRYSQALITKTRSLEWAKARLDKAESVDKNSKEALAAKEQLDNAYKQYEDLHKRSKEVEKSLREELLKTQKDNLDLTEQTERDKDLRAKVIRLEAALKSAGQKESIVTIKEKRKKSFENIKAILNEKPKGPHGIDVNRQGFINITDEQIVKIIPEISSIFEGYVKEGIINTSRIIDKMVALFKEAGTNITHQQISDAMGFKLDMKKELADLEQLNIRELQDKVKRSLERSIDNLEKKLKRDDIMEPKKANKVVMNEQLKALKDKKFELEKQVKESRDLQFEQEEAWKAVEGVVEERKYENRSLSEKIKGNLLEAVSLPKSLMASADFSAPLRQGAVLGFANPHKVPAAAREMFRQAFSEKKANRWLYDLKMSPEYKLMKDSELFLSEPTHKLSEKEESFMTNIAQKIPVWGRVVKGSERAYAGYLNKLRVDVFAMGADNMKGNPEALKAWADFINNATGRGSLGRFENSAVILNSTFFSPRLIASRFNLLNPATYINQPAPVRKMALRNMITFIGVGSAALYLAKAAGAEVEEDPRSSDFGKIKIGNTRIDIWAGFQQQVRTIAQIVSNQKKSVGSGDVKELGVGYKADTRADVLGSFFRNKLAPIPAAGLNLLSGKNSIGEDVTVKDELSKMVVPLIAQDVYSLYQEDKDAMKAMEYAIPAAFGAGVQTYKQKTSAPKTLKEKIEYNKEHPPKTLAQKIAEKKAKQ